MDKCSHWHNNANLVFVGLVFSENVPVGSKTRFEITQASLSDGQRLKLYICESTGSIASTVSMQVI